LRPLLRAQFGLRFFKSPLFLPLLLFTEKATAKTSAAAFRYEPVRRETFMPDMKVSRGYCNECGRNVMALAEVPNNLSWLVASLLTAGVGFIFWAIESFKPIVWRCSQCGTEQYREK